MYKKRTKRSMFMKEIIDLQFRDSIRGTINVLIKFFECPSWSTLLHCFHLLLIWQSSVVIFWREHFRILWNLKNDGKQRKNTVSEKDSNLWYRVQASQVVTKIL